MMNMNGVSAGNTDAFSVISVNLTEAVGFY